MLAFWDQYIQCQWEQLAAKNNMSGISDMAQSFPCNAVGKEITSAFARYKPILNTQV